MGKVVEGKFGTKNEVVYQCPFCQDGQTFWLHEDGVIECRACSTRQAAPREWLGKAVEKNKDLEE